MKGKLFCFIISVTLFLVNTSWAVVYENQSAGYQSVIWDGKDSIRESLPSGIYIYKVDAGKLKKTLKLLMLK